MGAKVECNNYLPFYDSNKDVWEDIKTTMNFGDAWPAYGMEMMLKTSQSCSIFKQDTMERCSEHDKEILKQTMLKHEEIFRSQVRELHRLYEVQKILMNDLRRKDFTPSAFSSTVKQRELMFHLGPEQQTSKDKRNIWDFLNGPVRERENRGHSHLTLGTSYMQTPGSGLMDHNTLIMLNPKEINGGSKDFKRLQPIRATRRNFDLERPADEYVDDEDVDQLREDTISRRKIHGNGQEPNLLNFQSDIEPESELQLTLSTGWERSKKEDDRQIGLRLDMGSNKQEREEAKEAKQSRFNEETVLFSAASTRVDVHTQEVLEKKRSVLPNQSFLGALWGFGQEYKKHEDHKSEWKMFDIEPVTNKERPSLDIEAGFVNSNTLKYASTPSTSALWIKNEDDFNQLPIGVHSKVYPVVPAAVDLQMQNLDLQSSSYGQESICSSTNGMNAIGEVPGFYRDKWYTNCNQSNSSRNQFTFSSLGQDLSQSPSADTPRSIHQQVGSHAMPSFTPCLSGVLLSGVKESSRSLKSPNIHELPHLLVSGGPNAGKGSQVSCHVDLSVAKKVDLTLGLSNHAIKNASYDASDHFDVKNQADSIGQENIEKVNRTNQNPFQESEHTNGGDTERSACFTIGLELFSDVQDPVEMISPIKNMGISDPVGKHLTRQEGIAHMSASHSSADEIVDRVVPISWKDNLKVSLGCDSTWKDNYVLNEKNGVNSGELQARDGVPKPGILNNQDFNEQLLASTGHNFACKPVNSYATACIIGCDIQMTTSKENIISGQHDKISNSNGAEPGFSCSDRKQTRDVECQFFSSSFVQQAEIEAPLCTQLYEKTAQYLELNVTGNGGVLPVHIEMEIKDITDDCGKGIEKPYQVDYINTDDCGKGIEKPYQVDYINTDDCGKGIEKQYQVDYIKSYVHEEEPDKLVREREILAHDSLHLSFSSTSSSGKLSQGNCSSQQNQKCLEQGLFHSNPVEMTMGQEGKNENIVCIEEADSELLKSAGPLAQIDKSNVEENYRPTLNSERFVDLSESTHLAAEALLKIRLENLKPLDVHSFSGPRSSLDWLSDMIPGNAECMEFVSAGSREELNDSLPSPDGLSNAKEIDSYEDPMPIKDSSPCSTIALDFFESMTLMLPESNGEEYCKPFAKDAKEWQKMISLSVNHDLRTRKRGKRLRDFQSEILPGIASLSRQEVTEDLQTIGFKRRARGGIYSFSEDWHTPSRGRRSRYLPVSNSLWPKSYGQEVDRPNGMQLSRKKAIAEAPNSCSPT